MKDPFTVLGVEPGASEDEIKKAYKKLAMEHHPDRHPDDKQAEERFKEISGAYETLKKNNWKQESLGGQFGFNGFPDINIDIEDLFRQAFGQGPFGRGRSAGYVKTGKLYISLEEAYTGCSKKIKVDDTTNCLDCKGFGYKLSDESCPSCNGAGQKRTTNGAMSFVTSCPACKGFGHTISAMCTKCNGKGKKKLDREFTVNVAPGIPEGSKINLANDVQVQVLFSSHKEFRLDYNKMDTASTKEIDMFTAVLGGVITTNTLGGSKNVKVPAGCQPETVLRIRKAGMRLRNATGDHLLQIKVKIPTNLTEEQRELLQTLKQQMEENNGG